MRSPRVGRKNDIARFTVAERVSGRVSQPTVPITRSKSPARTTPLTASVPIPPRCTGRTGSITARTRSTRSNSSRAPKCSIAGDAFHISASARRDSTVGYAGENGGPSELIGGKVPSNVEGRASDPRLL